MSTTISSVQRAGVVAHALRALAQHIEDHHLDVGDIVVNDHHLELTISGSDAHVWKASLRGGVDTIERRAAHDASRVDFITVNGRLPDSGVRVELSWVEMAPVGARVLRAVTR